MCGRARPRERARPRAGHAASSFPSATAPRTTAGRWTLTIALTVMAVLVAGVVGFVAVIAGSRFMAAETARPGLSLTLWTVAGIALATPVAALPTLGFVVRRRTTWLVAGVLAAAVVLVGFFGLNEP